ncbi:hypothetical protein NM688_g5957 [Phlebia brevispora]|uniref:Uncharacterized protein n=1 Tax=Phlebia brevispora TaxID=194682 RepID=A0ACC1SMB0_9APHY|nr:hypothetical protein NM688_g5957 [Phlebia brevispora]
MTSYISTLFWGTSQLDEAVDKATSEMLPSGSEDIALNLEISDQIRSKSVPPKDAMRALKRRLNHKNPNVQLLTLGLTDTCVKNGGDAFLVEVASREFMDNLVSILKIAGLNIDVKNKILRLIQNWAISFEGKVNLGYVGEVYRILQHEGFNFPPRDLTAAASAMVDTQTAPEWIDSDEPPILAELSSSRHRSARDFADAELQRAIQLSLEEVERQTNGYSSQTQADEEDDPDLRAAIEASLREANAPRPSAPLNVETPRTEDPTYAYSGYSQSYPPSVATPKPTIPTLPNYDLEPLEQDAILTFSQTVEQLQQQGGRDLSRYPAVTELYDKASGLRPKLAMSLSDTGRKEELLSEMHEKLSQAVKLYDKLLTEQVSHPPWRSATQPAATGYAPQYQAPAAPYKQWSQPATVGSPQMQTVQPSYFPAQAQPPVPEQQSSLPPSGAYVTSPVSEQYAQPQSYQSASVQPVSVPQYAPPVPVAVPVASPPAVQSPISQPQMAPPVAPVQSPPSQAPLSRHNTVSSAYPSMPAPPVNPQTKYLARANSISHTHTSSQLQQLQQTNIPQPLPNFPAAPTAVPHLYQQYSSPAPTEPEQREALLIDL